jgi:hypothetical protein
MAHSREKYWRDKEEYWILPEVRDLCRAPGISWMLTTIDRITSSNFVQPSEDQPMRPEWKPRIEWRHGLSDSRAKVKRRRLKIEEGAQ